MYTEVVFILVYHTHGYDKNRNYCNHFVEYDYNSAKNIGKTKNIFCIENKTFA